MTPDHPAAYGDAFADVYDDWYNDATELPDLVKTVRGLVGSGSLLELGGGTGRVALPLADAGVRVDTVDASLAMLRSGQAKYGWGRLNVICGDMARLPLRGTYEVALVAFNTLSNLTTERNQMAALSEVGRVLSPGGSLVVDLFVPATDMDPVRSAATRRSDGRGGTIVTSTTVRPESQRVEGTHTHHSASGAESTRHWAIRYLYPWQLDEMCSGQGLTLEARFEDWSGRRFEADSPRHISIFRRGSNTGSGEGHGPG
ncbi:MAG: class I SAM-dependent methyltransferase [Acidimicrobiales bacterium]